MKNSIFYLLPAPITENGWEFIPEYVVQIYHKIDYFLAENTKTARRFLKQIQHPLPQKDIIVRTFNKKSSYREVDELMQVLNTGKSIGYVSEAGSAAIADPGNRLVAWAHRNKIRVRALPGPISLMVALAASGLNGQNFHFHGYLPIKEQALLKKLKELVDTSLKNKTTHLFIETPYRVQKTFNFLIKNLHNDIMLCTAQNLLSDNELIKTLSIREWKKTEQPSYPKDTLCVFLIAAAGAETS